MKLTPGSISAFATRLIRFGKICKANADSLRRGAEQMERDVATWRSHNNWHESLYSENAPEQKPDWKLLCPECGSATFVDTHCPASDHPFLTTEFDECEVCDWTGNERRASKELREGGRDET